MNGLEIEKLSEFDSHKLVSFFFDPKTGLKGFIAIHRGGLTNPALGATRFWQYDSSLSALSDALRLSRMMSYKSALAGLKYGGAKAVLMSSPIGGKNREELFKSYARKVNYLGGKFVTGTDVGVTDEDVKLMRKETPYVIGTKVDPAHFTAVGVINGIHISLERVFGNQSISGKSFAVQGLGKTGLNIIEILTEEGAKIIASDVDAKKIAEAKKKFSKIKFVSSKEIHKQVVDVFVPCALSGVLNSKSISQLRCAIVAGSANNQLEEQQIGDLLHQLNILYAPDYVINAGGIISVVDEFENETPNQERILGKVKKIIKTLTNIFDRSKRYNRSPSLIANEMAEKIFNNHN